MWTMGVSEAFMSHGSWKLKNFYAEGRPAGVWPRAGQNSIAEERFVSTYRFVPRMQRAIRVEVDLPPAIGRNPGFVLRHSAF